MQTKLTHDELLRCGAAKRAICVLPWHHMPGGRDRWSDIAQDLNAMLANGTSDGRPWVEPERPIEKGEWVAVYDDATDTVFAIGRYRGDMGDDSECGRYAIENSRSLWNCVRRAKEWEISKVETRQ